MLRFDCNYPRVLIHTLSCLFLRTKCPCTEFPSRNAKISTLDPNNFFLAGFYCTKFKKPLFRPEFSLGLKRWTIISLCKFGQKISTPLKYSEKVVPSSEGKVMTAQERMAYSFSLSCRLSASAQPKDAPKDRQPKG